MPKALFFFSLNNIHKFKSKPQMSLFLNGPLAHFRPRNVKLCKCIGGGIWEIERQIDRKVDVDRYIGRCIYIDGQIDRQIDYDDDLCRLDPGDEPDGGRSSPIPASAGNQVIINKIIQTLNVKLLNS